MSKRMRQIREGIDFKKVYSLSEGINLIKSGARAKFNETVEIIFNLNLDTRKSEQNIRTLVSLPNGTGKTIRVAVFAKGEAAKSAKEAGADIVGDEDLVEQIQGGQINFDVCIATPDMMMVVGKLGKILGPRGLMPNPKLGTVTADPAKAVILAKAGQVELRPEKTGIVQAGIGKASFSEKDLEENMKACADALLKLKPNSVKGTYVKKIYISTTMGFALQIQKADLEQV